jgi:hypothetical protein
MFVVTKVTQRYDPQQDRIRLSLQNAAGDVLVLWLTQRLANQLAPALANWLEDSLKGSAGAESATTLHVWEQSAAQARLKPGRPVDPATATAEALPSTIELARGPKGYAMTFKWGRAGAARLTMNATELRQWLGILHRLFDTARWSKHAWPKWLSAAAAEGKPPASRRLLH